VEAWAFAQSLKKHLVEAWAFVHDLVIALTSIIFILGF
tara:strand:- start:2329 stop:2442 length:114 start_codon:yes stop_codon:yes gene_type:complete